MEMFSGRKQIKSRMTQKSNSNMSIERSHLNIHIQTNRSGKKVNQKDMSATLF